MRAVGREHRLRIPGRIVRREIARLAAVDARLRTDRSSSTRFRLALHARGEHELACCRARTCTRSRRRTVSRARRHRAPRSATTGSTARPFSSSQHEQLRDAAVAPRIPVPHEDAIVDACRSPSTLLACSRRSLRAGEIGAVGEDVQRHGEPRAVRREPERADVERQIRHLLGFAAAGRQSPHLRRAAARGQEVDVATVARPFGRVVVLRMRREPARLRALGREIERPQILCARDSRPCPSRGA